MERATRSIGIVFRLKLSMVADYKFTYRWMISMLCPSRSILVERWFACDKRIRISFVMTASNGQIWSWLQWRHACVNRWQVGRRGELILKSPLCQHMCLLSLLAPSRNIDAYTRWWAIGIGLLATCRAANWCCFEMEPPLWQLASGFKLFLFAISISAFLSTVGMWDIRCNDNLQWQRFFG